MNVSSSNSHPDHILLVDDNKLGLAARKAVLEELGYVITTAGSASEGLKRLAEADFSLVVTDYKMPRMNGDVFIAKVREKLPSIPIILLSGFVDALGLSEENTGADIVIQKSNHEVTHMVRGVRRLLRRKAPKKPPVSQPAATRARRKKTS
jgi:CheY-like chemotaxis protein